MTGRAWQSSAVGLRSELCDADTGYVTAGKNDSNIDVVLLFLHHPHSPWISSASVFPCREEEKQETDSKMKSSQQRIETEVKKTKGAQVQREKESGMRRRKAEHGCLLFLLSHLSVSQRAMQPHTLT